MIGKRENGKEEKCWLFDGRKSVSWFAFFTITVIICAGRKPKMSPGH